MAGAEENKVEIGSPEGKSPAAPPPEVVSVELPAPAGWKKKFTPKKGGTPRRNEIVFISPTCEEIRSKRQLDQYRRSHPDSPAAAEFDWGTGDTPRRSARISEKAKATETPEGEPLKKRERKYSSNSGAKEQKGGGDGVDGDSESADTAAPVAKDTADTEMKEAEDDTNKSKLEGAASEAAANEGTVVQDSDDKPKEEEAKTEEKKVDEPKEEVKIMDKEVDPREEEMKIEGKKLDEPCEETETEEKIVCVFKEVEVETREKNVFVDVASKVEPAASLPKADEGKDEVGKEDQVNSEVPYLTCEHKEEASADKEIKDEHLKPVSGGRKDEWGSSITKDVHSINFDDPQPPHKTSVSC